MKSRDAYKGVHVGVTVIVSFICVLSLLTTPLEAHKVNVFAYVEGDKVIVEGYFSGNVKAMDSFVEVFDETGKKLHQGKTDRKGQYSFSLSDLPPFSGGLKIILDAEMGHKAEFVIPPADLPSPVKRETPGPDRTQPGPPPVKHMQPEQQTPIAPRTEEGPPDQSSLAPPPEKAQLVEPVTPSPHHKAEPEEPKRFSGTPHVQAVDVSSLSAALEAILDKKLESIIRMLGRQERLILEQQQSGPKLSDIVGGIGWILGLAGITAFFMSRSR